jgi:hypothetical protein
MCRAAVVTRGVIGFFGFFAPRETYIIDPLALSDAFLSKLPANPVSRIGHFERDVPQGYPELLSDPCLNELKRNIEEITRGAIFSASRWRAIVSVNLGQHRRCLPASSYGFLGQPLTGAYFLPSEELKNYRGLHTDISGHVDAMEWRNHQLMVRGWADIRNTPEILVLAGFASTLPTSHRLERRERQDVASFAGDMRLVASGFELTLTFKDEAEALAGKNSLCLFSMAFGAPMTLIRSDNLACEKSVQLRW